MPPSTPHTKRPPPPSPSRPRLHPPLLTHSKSIQSITSSDGTTILSTKSSLFDLVPDRGKVYRRPSGSLGGAYGTIRTMTTESTEPCLWDDDLDEARAANGDEGAGAGKKQDLSRVNEEEDESSQSGCEKRARERNVQIYLGKGKFPDDFVDVFGSGRGREKELPPTPLSVSLPTPSSMREKEKETLPSPPSPISSRTSTRIPTPTRMTRSPSILSRSPTRITTPTRIGSPTRITTPTRIGSPTTPMATPTRIGSPTRITTPTRMGSPTTPIATPTRIGSPTRTTTPTKIGSPTRTRTITRSPTPSRSLPGGMSSSTSLSGSLSVSGGGRKEKKEKMVTPPKKLAVVGTNNESSASGSSTSTSGKKEVKASAVTSSSTTHSPPTAFPLPRRPSHWARGGAVAESEPGLRKRSTSVDIGGSSSGSGIERIGGSVPFPRTNSGEYYAPSHPSTSLVNLGIQRGMSRGGGKTNVRERWRSNVEGGRRRPSSYDEIGLSGVMGKARISASVNDLREHEFTSRKLVVREEGKPPTRYQLGNCIGKGQFGSVYRALNENTGQMVAVKRISLEGLKEEEVTQLMKEVDLVKSLSHPSVVKYEGMVREEGMLNIVLEYAENGSLGQTLKSFGKLKEGLVARYVVKILEGLHYLHRSNIVHCDLKAANILTTKNGNVKLTDFGVSLNLRAMEREMGACVSGEKLGIVAGTPNWMAPEVIELKGASTKSDIWSLGCTVVELLTGRPPYADIGNAMSVMFRIVEDPIPPLPDNCERDELLKDFLIRCFHKSPALRPSAEDLSEHPWLKKNWDAFKDLKAQDSIPWIRRVSADFPKNDAIRYLSQLDINVLPESGPISSSPTDHHHRGALSSRMVGRRTSAASASRRTSDTREHGFVKTTFSEPMTCRVCLTDVKKSAVICGQCSLISHSKCAPNAPPTCDLRAQLLEYAEKGNQGSVAYAKNDHPISDGEHNGSPLSSPLPTTTSPVVEHSPTGRKFMAAFKRSRSNLTPELGDEEGHSHRNGGGAMQRLFKRSFGALHPSHPSLPLPLPPPPPPPFQAAHERPVSLVTSCSSSLRSAATANESFSSPTTTTGSRGDSPVVFSAGMRGRKSSLVLETVPGSRPTTCAGGGMRSEEVFEVYYEGEVEDTRVNVPGGFEPRKRKRRGSGNCILQ